MSPQATHLSSNSQYLGRGASSGNSLCKGNQAEAFEIRSSRLRVSLREGCPYKKEKTRRQTEGRPREDGGGGGVRAQGPPASGGALPQHPRGDQSCGQLCLGLLASRMVENKHRSFQAARLVGFVRGNEGSACPRPPLSTGSLRSFCPPPPTPAWTLLLPSATPRRCVELLSFPTPSDFNVGVLTPRSSACGLFER